MSENICEKVLIEAYTGSGKTYSIMNIDPDQAMLIQVIPKRLTFPEGINWRPWDNKEKKGSIMSVSRIRDAAEKNKISFASALKSFVSSMVTEHNKQIIIIDDLVYVMTQSFMKNIDDKGYDKWNELAAEITSVLTLADELKGDARIYYLTHPEEDANGKLKMKTAGKLVDNLVTPEGLFNTVIGATVKEGKHWFKVGSTNSSENYKCPMGMFTEDLIPSDLEDFDTVLCSRLGINKEINEEKLLKRIENNNKNNKKAHEKRIVEAFI